jgi:hypothetical protein
MGLLTASLTMPAAGMVAHLVTTGAASSAGSSAPAATSPWVIAALALLGSSVVGGLITTVLGNLRTAATARREGYARAVKTLIARSEYPYRVRRRVSDAPEVLAALVERGQDLQEQVAACRTWVASEHRVLGNLFEQALADIDAAAGPYTSEAWNSEPTTTAAGMNLGGWGPGDQWPHLSNFERGIAIRFGWRRLLPCKYWLRNIPAQAASKRGELRQT